MDQFGGSRMVSQETGRLAVGLLLLAVMAFVVSCSTPWSAYRTNVFQGRDYLQKGDYSQARTSFLQAGEIAKTPYAYALAATASYKMGDLEGALSYVQEAERIKDRGGFAVLRVAGYRALVLLKSGKTEEGLTALKAYLDVYEHLLPLMNIENVQRMYREKRVDLPALEMLIDQQVNTFETEVRELYDNRTGFLGQRSDPGGR